MKNRALWVLAAGASLCAAAPPISFAPTNAALAPATEEYRLLWQADGLRIVASLEAAAGVSFPQAPIKVLVTEGASMAAFDGRSIRLRASHSPEQRKAMLIHELGHRLSFGLPPSAELDDHRLLYLFLYDVWCDLYGKDFADRMVAIERRSSANYVYDGAWGWALAMSRTERQARLQALRSGTGEPA